MHPTPYISIMYICWITEKAREFQKNIYFCFTDYTKAFDYVDHNKLWKIHRDHLTYLLRNLYVGQEWDMNNGLVPNWENSMTVYCHPAYLTYMQCTSWEVPS